jgi:hypothetical protein
VALGPADGEPDTHDALPVAAHGADTELSTATLPEQELTEPLLEHRIDVTSTTDPRPSASGL